MHALILISVFVVATCSLIYELLAGTLASYLLGDSVLQFSTVIGTYMFALGLGSWLSKFIEKDLNTKFVRLQLAIGTCGGVSAALLFLTFGYTNAASFRFILYAAVSIIGMLSGLEVPMLLRILKDKLEFKELLSQVLSLDYIGSLIASLLFPLFFVPFLGLIRTSAFFGFVNIVVAIGFLYLFPVPKRKRLQLLCEAILAGILLISIFIMANKITKLAEESLYTDNIIISRQTQYQRLIVTRRNDDVRLYLNNNLQFSSQDESRYHESLTLPPLQAAESVDKVLILGGGDGMAARELLRNHNVKHIDLVDLDPEMTKLFSEHPLLISLNENSLNSPKLTIHNQDAFIWINSCRDMYDVILVDFPDPSNFSVGKLYTHNFFRKLTAHLKPGGVGSIQCTSPYFARQSYWCIVNTLASTGVTTYPYHVNVPSFGEWGFCLFAHKKIELPQCQGQRFLTPEFTKSMFAMPKDMAYVDTDINQLHNQILVHYYDKDWQTMEQ
ncbi:MAG: polyamine aminopropyltransferase [Candidatus Bruticola sp.]